MTRFGVLIVVALMGFSSSASAQETMKKGDKAWTELEATLREANLHWLCQGDYFKAKRQDCVDMRAQYWADQFFEMGQNGTQTKAQMVEGQTAGAKTYPDVVRGEGPNPTQFTLMAVYNHGNFALGVDHTTFKIRMNSQGQPDFAHVAPNNQTGHWYPDESGKLAVVREVTFVRIFVKENGKWRPAAGASVPVPPSK